MRLLPIFSAAVLLRLSFNQCSASGLFITWTLLLPGMILAWGLGRVLIDSPL